jgi:hypothetical protein
VASANFFPALIDAYFAQCDIDGVQPDPPGLILALGMTSRREYEDARKVPAVAKVLDEATLRMASKWYQLLTKKDSKINVLGVTYALKTMGFHDHFKAQGADLDTLNLQFNEADKRL